MHRLVKEPDGSTVLYIGAENWPFPIPLTSKNGAWYLAALLAKTAKAAEAGQFELYKTTHHFDGTVANPQWLG